jgi:hypothetical protein
MSVEDERGYNERPKLKLRAVDKEGRTIPKDQPLPFFTDNVHMFDPEQRQKHTIQMLDKEIKRTRIKLLEQKEKIKKEKIKEKKITKQYGDLVKQLAVEKRMLKVCETQTKETQITIFPIPKEFQSTNMKLALAEVKYHGQWKSVLHGILIEYNNEGQITNIWDETQECYWEEELGWETDKI